MLSSGPADDETQQIKVLVQKQCWQKDQTPGGSSCTDAVCRIECTCDLWLTERVKAGLRPRGTIYSLAYSAQSLSPCLSLFVERLIKERSALRGFTVSGSLWADEHGHPIMSPTGLVEGSESAQPLCGCVWGAVNKAASVSSRQRLQVDPECWSPDTSEYEWWLRFGVLCVW